MEDKQAQLLAKWGEKISKMAKAIGGLEEDGVNTFSKYKYISSNNLFGGIRSNLSPCQLAIIPNLESFNEETFDSGSKKWRRTTVHMTFEIIDTETGYMRIKKWSGSDQDTGGKSFGQAVTECTKRFYFKLFQVSSKEDSDPDTKTTEETDQKPDLRDKLTNGTKKKAEPKKEKLVEKEKPKTYKQKISELKIDKNYIPAINSLQRDEKLYHPTGEKEAKLIYEMIIERKGMIDQENKDNQPETDHFN